MLYSEKVSDTEKVKVPDLTGLTVSEANRKAINSGINIKISGYTTGTEITSYRQSVTADTEVAMGTIVTVSFKTSQDIEDHAE